MVYQFEEINVQINRWVVLIITLFSILGNMVNIAVFLRPVFNHHVCSWYLLALATNNCLYSVTVLVYRILTDGFQIQIFSNSFSVCQFISFMNTFCTGLSHYLIVFTAIDRWSASSTNVRHSRFNSFQVMPWSVLTILVFCAVVAVSSAVVTELGTTDGLGCSIRATTIYNQFYLIVQLVLFAIIAPILMIIFTLLTIQNRKMTGDLPITVSRCRKMEYHLTQIFFLLVTVHIMLNLLEWIEYLILFRPNMFGSCMLIQTMIRMPIYASFAVPIVWYLILGIEFRRELGKMIPILAPLFGRIQINTTVNNDVEAHVY
ncbi:unnamed protein product [Rotaria magnacalcarata]|uniref:G-protein coupled receptors family 1 profile domain-containing protein n=1 Tax=Rotaria magnacalcarata TaxID=392030 RepID=A0A816WED8_9BILA|nr:unnamed protein product [Rotaria magnacalcarata]CAF2136753.1 unnamed protein product [Rotaria magnacalcarata]CAF3794153.1 unnamed protein product [Rotaria magnacalcarata]CAF3904516.1 unnamed protein product [Rotaria magnacalcarata]